MCRRARCQCIFSSAELQVCLFARATRRASVSFRRLATLATRNGVSHIRLHACWLDLACLAALPTSKDVRRGLPSPLVSLPRAPSSRQHVVDGADVQVAPWPKPVNTCKNTILFLPRIETNETNRETPDRRCAGAWTAEDRRPWKDRYKVGPNTVQTRSFVGASLGLAFHPRHELNPWMNTRELIWRERHLSRRPVVRSVSERKLGR